MSRLLLVSLLTAAAAAAFIACDDSNDPADGELNETVEEVLIDLGVDIATSPRLDYDGEPLPDSYTPLGERRTVNRFVEILPFGLPLDDEEGPLGEAGRSAVIDITPESGNTFASHLLADPTLEEAVPTLFDEATPRSAAAGDYDDDGLDEVAFVYQEAGNPVELRILQDGDEAYAVGAPVTVSLDDASQLFLAAGDFDGSGSVDLVVALTHTGDGGTTVTFLSNNSGAFTVEADSAWTIPTVVFNQTQVDLAVGNLDSDMAAELVLVVNEYGTAGLLSGSGTTNDGSSRYFIHDDAASGFEELATGPVAITVGLETINLLGAAVDVADVDGDSVDEVVLGGLSRIGNMRGDPPEYAVEVLDDAKRDLVSLISHRVPSGVGVLQPQASGANQHMNTLALEAFDADGDGSAEIMVNQFLFEDIVTPTEEGLSQIGEIPLDDLLLESRGGQYRFHWASSSFAAGDVNSDGREELIFYSQRQSPSTPDIQVWGIDQIDGWSQIASYPVPFSNYSTFYRPILLAPDVDLDVGSMALRFSAGSHRLIFTEPILIAALAAAPCAENLGQDLDESCRTAFGQAVSETTTRENSWSVVAGVSVGFAGEVPLVGSAEAVVNTRNTVRNIESDAYTLTRRVLYETGSIEDSVIFTTVPYDIYTYEVLSHPNPELLGEQIEVRLPRDLVVLMVSRDFYNETIDEGALPVDEAIFTHTEGDPWSYPTSAERDRLLTTYPGLQSDAQEVGQGGGQRIVSITEFESTTEGTSYDFEATLDLRATSSGVVGGFSIGGGVGFDLQITRGEETIYQGAVGDISADAFREDLGYSWGLFAYIYDDAPSGQTFEVLNYWVDP